MYENLAALSIMLFFSLTFKSLILTSDLSHVSRLCSNAAWFTVLNFEIVLTSLLRMKNSVGCKVYITYFKFYQVYFFTKNTLRVIVLWELTNKIIYKFNTISRVYFPLYFCGLGKLSQKQAKFTDRRARAVYLHFLFF